MQKLMSAAILIATLLGHCHEISAQTFDTNSFCAIVDLGENNIYACVSGSAPITVVLEAGMREDSRAWRFVVDELSEFATVVAYDRAGMGQSDSSTPPRTSEKIAHALKSLLDRLPARAPYILVGHSAGGWHVRTFAHFYPQLVAGMVLLDSPHEDFEARRNDLLNIEERRAREAMLAESRARLPEAIRLEYEGIEQTRALYPKLQLPRALPLLVLTAERHQWVPERNAHRQEEIWRELQGRLAKLSDNGKFLVVAGSGHNIQIDRPDEVVQAIREIAQRISR